MTDVSLNTYSEAVGRNVRTAIQSAGVPQATVAAAAGMSSRTLIRRLKGKTPFEIEELARIGAYLRVNVHSFLPATARETAA